MRSHTSATQLPSLVNGDEELPGELALAVFRQMVRTRVLEERSIKLSKSGQAHFWVGGPGEEVTNVILGMQFRKGRGPAYDYAHLHYRNAGFMIALGMPLDEHLQQATMRVTDPHSMGRNFVGHYSSAEWNVIPVTSVITVQFVMAPGTALMQKRNGGDGVSLVIGGDAGTAEGDFTSCMIWSTRPFNEVPVLMLVTNNRYGISTPYDTQHAEERISSRGEPFGIPGETFDGNDAVTTWHAIRRGYEYCREYRRPYLLEAMVSRLHGHSSSSGARRVEGERDCVAEMERALIDQEVADREWVDGVWREAREEVEEAVRRVLSQPEPRRADLERHTYAPSEYDAIYPEDYTGLPE